MHLLVFFQNIVISNSYKLYLSLYNIKHAPFRNNYYKVHMSQTHTHTYREIHCTWRRNIWKVLSQTLPAVVPWLEGQPAHLRVSGSLPDQGHGPELQVWSPALLGCWRQPLNISLSPPPLILSLPLCLKFNGKKKSLGED